MDDSSITDYIPASLPAKEVTETDTGTDTETVMANDQNPDNNPPPPPPPDDNALDEMQARMKKRALVLSYVDVDGSLFTLDLNREPIEHAAQFYCTVCISFAAVMIAGLVFARF